MLSVGKALEYIEQHYYQKSKKAINFSVGDTVKVNIKITDGNNNRIQSFTGYVLAIRNPNNISASFIVRKFSHGSYVERTFALNSPIIKNIELIKRGKVRRAKLYYLRKLVGKAAQIPEKIITKSKIKSNKTKA